MSSLQKKRNRRVLIVDDEADVLEFLTIYLESQSWEVTAVDSPEKALEELHAHAYFLTITDIAMPSMDGYEFISHIHQSHYTCQIALMTGFGYNPKHTLVKINKSMKYPCLFKPFNRSKVSETVQAAYEDYHRDLT
jgi:DNA-binding NtrC family response regulator